MVISESVLSDPRSTRRLDAMLSRIDGEDVQVLTDEAVEACLAAVGRREELRRGGVEGLEQPKELVAFAHLRGEEVFPGYSWRELRSARRERDERQVLCRTGVEIQSAVGCPFDCAYCPYSAFLCVRLDVERFADRVVRLAGGQKGQTLFKLNNRSDTLGLEPEYGLASVLVRRFAALPGRYLLLYAKGDSVDHLLDLPHGGKTVASFTLTPEPVADLLERAAPSPARRLAAIEKLGAAGYPVRVRLSPIVPVRGWREHYRSLIARLVAAARPEMVTLWTLSMVELGELPRIVPLEDLDEEALVACRAAEERMAGVKGAPFPPELRAALYREIAAMVQDASPSTQVALCLETAEVWDGAAGPLTPRRGSSFLCNCGPMATPEAVRRGGKPTTCATPRAGSLPPRPSRRPPRPLSPMTPERDKKS